MPWEWLFYIAKVQLNFSEQEFWKLTPRKLLLIWSEHKRFNGWNEKEEQEKELYIDEVSWL